MVAVPSKETRNEDVPRVVCDSPIRSVVVYARGAVVTREVQLPEGLPSERVDLVVEAITPLAAPGTFRVEAGGGREALGVVTELEIPEDGALTQGELSQAIEEAERAFGDLQAERTRIEQRRQRFARSVPMPALSKRKHLDAPDDRVQNALAAQRILSELEEGFDRRLVELDRALAKKQEELEALRAEALQRESAARAGPHHPRLKAVIRLSEGDGASALALSYAVEEARWWPTYSVQLSDSARRAELWVDALVAQASLEDWSGVRISLCTADLVQDVRLPELSSLKLGRAQPPKKRGFRPPPDDLDQLFAGFEDAVAGAPPAIDSIPSILSTLCRPPAPSRAAPKPSWDDSTTFDEEITGAGVLYAPEGALTDIHSDLAPPAAPVAMEMAGGGPPPAPQAMAAPVMARSAGPGAVLGGVLEAAADGIASLAESAVTRFGSAGPSGIEPADAWLDFDALKMGDVDDPSERGRLVRTRRRLEIVAELRAEISLASDPGPALRDPMTTRGSFDHRYESEGDAEVPSNGRPHRITLFKRDLEAKPRFVSAPRETADVFREVELVNALDAPLLAGPVDVMLDGALLTTTHLEHAVDRGGGFVVGLGVEERVRVARNARVRESTVGMLSSSTAVDHEVTIDLVSGLGHPITVEILERIPVTDDRNVEIELVESTPRAETYDQSERGRPIDGGLRWRLPLEAGAKRSVAYRYRIELPAKSEIVGGNRRE